ncbi:hypothetical protein M0805_005735 [Coniferiporia weirii]|nr:hypothetical protein M0805_005735 [Coniferiporia weirii]
MAIGPSEAMLISLMMESFLFGVLTLLFASTIYILFLRRKNGQPLSKLIAIVSTSMYVMAIMHISINLHRIITGFTKPSGRQGGSDAYFSNLSDPTYIFTSVIYVIQTFLGDSFAIYRLHVVWGGDRRVVVPAVVCFSGCFCTGIGSLVLVSVSSPTTDIFVSNLKRWIISFYTTTLATNCFCTALIAYRIWSIGFQIRAPYRSRRLSTVVAAIVESGLIYSATLFALIVTYLCNTWGETSLYESTIPLIGIVFSLIIVRIGLGISHDSGETRHMTFVQYGPNSGNHLSFKGPAQPVAVQMMRIQTARDDNGDPIELSSVISNSSNTTHHGSKSDVRDGLGMHV